MISSQVAANLDITLDQSARCLHFKEVYAGTKVLAPLGWWNHVLLFFTHRLSSPLHVVNILNIAIAPSSCFEVNSSSQQVSAPATRNKLLLSEKPAIDASYAEKMVQQKALIKNFGRQTGARYYQKVEEMMVDGKSKEQQILKAAGSVDVEKLPSQAEEGGENDEGGVKSLLPPRDETAVDIKKVKVVTCDQRTFSQCFASRCTRWRIFSPS